MELGLKGKVALVTAASRGLGRAIANEFAAEGAALVICSRNADDISAAAQSIESETGAKVVALTADVSDPVQVDRLVERANIEFGRIDILVTNAGGPPSGTFESLSLESWVTAFRLTLMSVVNLARQVLPGMKQRRWGRILNVTSIAAKQPVDNLILSNSLRAGVTGFARTLANEVGAFGITVNNILPGYTLTERVEKLARDISAKEGTSPAEAIGRWEKEIPLRRLGEPREFAALAAFLASERASYITAQSIAVDGGWIKSLL